MTSATRPAPPQLEEQVQDDEAPRPVRAFRPRRPGHLIVGGIVLAYLLAGVLGVTTSSLGTGAMRQDPSSPSGTTIGAPRDIRSDEWQVETPFLLGLGETGTTSVGTPLAERPDLLVGIPTAGGVFTSIVDFDGALMRLGTVLPVASLFALHWWLPWLLLLLALPPWLRRVGANVPMSWLATALVAAAPATAWWSGFPIRIIGFAAAGSLLGMISADAYGRHRRVLGTASGLGAGLLLARLGTWYIPWSLTLGVPLVLATVCWLLVEPRRRRSGLAAIGVAGGTAGVLLAGLYYENWSALMANAGTVYPGARRSSGAPQALALLFGAPGDAYFQLGRPLAGSNVSELSSGFTFCAIWALAIYLGATRSSALVRMRHRTSGLHGLDEDRSQPLGERAVLAVLAASTVLWLVWCTVSLGRLGAALPILNRVPPSRAAQTVGFLAVLVVALLLSREGRAVGWRVPLAAAGGSAGVTAYGVSSLQAYAPGIGAPMILGLSGVVFLGVLFVTRAPDRWLPATAVAVLAVLGVAYANPIQLGVGDLRTSATARTLLAAGERARADDAYWATDGADTDAILIATGVPTLSGEQLSGPDEQEWLRLDPSRRYEDAWNRGSSSIEFSWSTTGAPVIASGAPDQILVQVDPCDLGHRGFHVTHVLSRAQLPNSCLTPQGTVTWDGTTRYVYEVGTGRG